MYGIRAPTVEGLWIKNLALPSFRPTGFRPTGNISVQPDITNNKKVCLLPPNIWCSRTWFFDRVRLKQWVHRLKKCPDARWENFLRDDPLCQWIGEGTNVQLCGNEGYKIKWTLRCKSIMLTGPLLTDWFARKIKTTQWYLQCLLLLTQFRFVQLLTKYHRVIFYNGWSYNNYYTEHDLGQVIKLTPHLQHIKEENASGYKSLNRVWQPREKRRKKQTN